uniref:Peptidase S1 domain-containing protein n=1 Tax=Panagrellus redivivus TaxID=6233 RepID=A0A7E4V7G7_PANRE
MLKFLCLVALACITVTAAKKTTCGFAFEAQQKYHKLDPFDKPFEPRVYHGDVPNFHLFPFTAAIGVKNNTDGAFCTASIIGSRYIMSAAHCYLERGLGKETYLALNDIIYGAVEVAKAKRAEIEDLFLTPESTYDNYDDIMILKLKEEISFDENAKPVCLTADIEPEVGKQLIVTGFGNHSIGPDRFQTMDKYVVDTVPVRESYDCDNPASNHVMKDHTFCAGAVERGTMSGDSGGPLYALHQERFYQLGIVAEGTMEKISIDGKELHDDRGEYTRVGDFCDFIETVTDSEVRCRTSID